MRTTSHVTQIKKKKFFFLQPNWKIFIYFYWITSFLAHIIHQLLYYFSPLSILGGKLIQKKLSTLIEIKKMRKKKSTWFDPMLSLCKLEHIWIWLFKSFIIFSCGKLILKTLCKEDARLREGRFVSFFTHLTHST